MFGALTMPLMGVAIAENISNKLIAKLASELWNQDQVGTPAWKKYNSEGLKFCTSFRASISSPCTIVKK